MGLQQRFAAKPNVGSCGPHQVGCHARLHEECVAPFYTPQSIVLRKQHPSADQPPAMVPSAMEIDRRVRIPPVTMSTKYGVSAAWSMWSERIRALWSARFDHPSEDRADLSYTEIAAKLDVCTHTAGVWRTRFARNRLDGL